MVTTRTKNYFQRKKETTPIKSKEEVRNHPDNKIDQDFPGFPSGHSKENIIKPQTAAEKKTADVDNKDGEKINKPTDEIDEEDSDGSGGAFLATEELKE